MKREYIISFQLDNNQSNANMFSKSIAKKMELIGCSLTSKNTPDDDYIFLTFNSNSISTLDTIGKVVNEVLEDASKKEVKLSSQVSSHVPKLLVDYRDIGTSIMFSNLLETELFKEVAPQEIKFNGDESVVVLSFENDKTRDSFKEKYASELIKSKKPDGLIEVDWSDSVLVDKNNFASRKKTMV